MKIKRKKDRATAYAHKVLSGEILAGAYVRGACQRHLNDLEKSKSTSYPFAFSEHKASEAIAFFEEVLHLNGGQYEGKPFLLFAWQDFIIGSLFGWERKKNKKRRFRVAYIEGAKGCGKSPLAAGIGLMGMLADGEARAEIYAAATKRDQAMILFRDAVAMYELSPEINKRLIASGVGEKCWNLSHLESGSFFRVISSDKKQSGPRPHIALLDEIHEHTDGTAIEMLRAGFKFREQPLSFMITNAGHNTSSVCWEYHDMGSKIALEQIQNDEFFSYICSLDEEDLENDKYLTNESLWPKVNPSLIHGLPGYNYIRSQIKEAYGLPSKMATVKRLCFCVWTEAENPAISRDAWEACKDKDYPLEILQNRRCWGGLDLSAVHDLTAFALVFEPSEADPYWRLKVWFWLPGVELKKKEDQDHVPYIAWRDAGYINAVPRKTIEYDFVVKDIFEICNKFSVQKIAFDRAYVEKYFLPALDRSGYQLPEIMPFGQGYLSMGPAVKVFEKKLIGETLRHDGNPCLTWNAACVVAEANAAGDIKYSKNKATGRIDGIIAAVMACGILEEVKTASVYDSKTKDEIRKSLLGQA